MNTHFRELLVYRNKEVPMDHEPLNKYFTHSQLKESLVFQGKEVAMECDPLSQYFSQLKSPPRFLSTCKSNERGYLGKWAILKNELHLIEFIGVLERNVEVTLEYLFPEKHHVFAEWFTGEIVLNQGKLLALKSENHPAVYEKDIHLEFANGHLINTHVVENALDKTTGYIDSLLSRILRNSSL
jgi:hypothetical protein